MSRNATPLPRVPQGFPRDHDRWFGILVKTLEERIGALELAIKTGWLVTNASPLRSIDATTAPALGMAGLIGRQLFTTTGAYTYTPTTGTELVFFELQGAGGGGGAGAGNPGAGKVTIGGSGSAGAYLCGLLTTSFSGSGSVGAKGTGGASGASNAGTDGGDTTFTSAAPVTYTARGGLGDGTVVAGTPPYVTGAKVGGTFTNGDYGRDGGAAGFGVVAAVTSAASGLGGRSAFSNGGWSAQNFAANTGQPGLSASGKGGGGSGCVINGTGTTQAGGDGSDGMAIFWEYRTSAGADIRRVLATLIADMKTAGNLG